MTDYQALRFKREALIERVAAERGWPGVVALRKRLYKITYEMLEIERAGNEA